MHQGRKVYHPMYQTGNRKYWLKPGTQLYLCIELKLAQNQILSHEYYLWLIFLVLILHYVTRD